jgi:hypothetical protein
VRTGVIGCLLLAIGAWSHAQTAVQARLLLDDEAMAHCAVYVVDIERRGSDTRGALVAELPNGWRAVYPMDLAANARKRLYLPVPSAQTSRFAFARLLWRGADGERVRVELPTPLQTHLPIVFVGNRVGGWESLNGAKAPFASALAADHDRFSPPIHAYYLRPAALPDDWRGLLGLPVLVLVDGAEALTDGQWQAVRQWLAAGGTLVVSAGSFGAAVNLLPLADLMPRLSLSDAPVRPVTPPLAPPDQPVRLMRPETLQGYRVLLGGARAPVMLYRRVGAGNLYLFLGDLGDPVWRALGRAADADGSGGLQQRFSDGAVGEYACTPTQASTCGAGASSVGGGLASGGLLRGGVGAGGAVAASAAVGVGRCAADGADPAGKCGRDCARAAHDERAARYALSLLRPRRACCGNDTDYGCSASRHTHDSPPRRCARAAR